MLRAWLAAVSYTSSSCSVRSPIVATGPICEDEVQVVTGALVKLRILTRARAAIEEEMATDAAGQNEVFDLKLLQFETEL